MATQLPNQANWSWTVDEIKETTQKVIDFTKKGIDDIAAIPAKERTFQNTIKQADELDIITEPTSSGIYLLASVSPSKEIRDAANDANIAFDKANIEFNAREDFYKAFVDYKENNAEEISKLPSESSRYIEKSLNNFIRNGLALSADKRETLKQIKMEISENETNFSKVLNEEKSFNLFTKEELDGMPEDYLKSLKQEDGKYVVTLKYPDFFPLMTHCKVEATRKTHDLLNGLKAVTENTKPLEDTLLLREKEANLLGYENHADYILAERMAKDSATATKFLKDLTALVLPYGEKDKQLLEETKKKFCEENNVPFTPLHGYDWRFFENVLLQRDYQVDHNTIKEYFPLQKVTDGMFDIYQQLLSLRFVEVNKEKKGLWHPDVCQYEVYDKDTNKLVGEFYTDLFPREGKYGHAACFTLRKRATKINGEIVTPIAAVVANFTKPTEDKPSLLLFNEVETFFHEFGHVMHVLCSTANFHMFSGTSVERDFVEAPSQMLENWCYNEESLKKMSGHYQDLSKPLPKEMVDKLIKAKTFLEPWKTLRQLLFGTFDMTAHVTKGKVDTKALWHELAPKITLLTPQPDANPAASFGHIMGGYSASYYGYLWSLVYACDMFDRFLKEGVLNPETGRAYRNEILAPGKSRDAMVSITKFLGREPKQESFLRQIGITN